MVGAEDFDWPLLCTPPKFQKKTTVLLVGLELDALYVGEAL